MTKEKMLGPKELKKKTHQRNYSTRSGTWQGVIASVQTKDGRQRIKHCFENIYSYFEDDEEKFVDVESGYPVKRVLFETNSSVTVKSAVMIPMSEFNTKISNATVYAIQDADFTPEAAVGEVRAKVFYTSPTLESAIFIGYRKDNKNQVAGLIAIGE